MCDVCVLRFRFRSCSVCHRIHTPNDTTTTTQQQQHTEHPSPMSRSRTDRSRLLFWTIAIPLFFTLIWKKLDANPSLWVYDGIMKMVESTTTTSSTNFVNQTVWVTGASSGIGASLVCNLIQGQAGHVIMSSRNITKLEHVRDECKERYPNSSTIVSIIQYDAMKQWKTQSVVQEALQQALAYKKKGGIDVLFLNAGVYQTRLALETTIEETKRISRINYEAPVELALELLKQDGWKERGKGSLVVTSSVTAKGPQALCSSYAASKAALTNYFQTLSTEEFTWLSVYMVIVGGTKTNLWSHLNYNVDQPNEENLMDPDRVASLMTRAVSVHSFWGWWMFYEIWITKNIGLLYMVLNMYAPNLFHLGTHWVGLARRISLERDHTDLLGVMTIVQNLAGYYMGWGNEYFVRRL